MPWTFAHPAAVLPLRPLRRLSFGALVVGSISPDIGYYVGHFDLAGAAHTLSGLVTLSLPTGLVLMVFVRLLHRPVADLLPRPHRQALLLLPQMPPLTSLMTAWRVSIAILIGASTHIAWDSFTHGTGTLVAMIPLLRMPVHVFGIRTLRLFDVLQHASTALGVAVLFVAYARWLRSVGPGPAAWSVDNDRWRYALLSVLAATSLLAAPPAAYLLSTSTPAGTNVALFIVRCVILCTTVFVAQLSVAALWVARGRRQPGAGQGARPSLTPSPMASPSPKIEKGLELRRDGPEDDLEL